MTREQWLEERRTLIGGTDAGAILGVNPFKSPVDIYCEKLGLVEPEPENEAMQWGKILEPVIAEQFCREEGLSVLELTRGSLLRNQVNPIIGGTPDYLLSEKKVGLECKTAGLRTAHLWGESDSDKVPMQYLVQCLWYCAVTGFDVWKLAVLIGGQDFRVYTIQRDRELEQTLITKAVEFWREHVEKQVPPPLDGSNSAREYLKRKYPRHCSDELLIADDPETLELVAEYGKVRSQFEKIEAEAEMLKNRLCERIGDAPGILCDGHKVTWKANKDSSIVDWKAVVESINPPKELIEQHTKTKPGARVFRFAEVKNG